MGGIVAFLTPLPLRLPLLSTRLLFCGALSWHRPSTATSGEPGNKGTRVLGGTVAMKLALGTQPSQILHPFWVWSKLQVCRTPALMGGLLAMPNLKCPLVGPGYYDVAF